ncbi:MAG: UDP-N-acetylglucosamine 1-carboxyvinyltransferase [Alphaproteobacteria bacterium]
MDVIRIEGGVPLRGTIPISGAKNAALPLMAACLLTGEKLTLSNLPDLADIRTMRGLLASFGVKETGGAGEITLDAGTLTSTTADYELVRTMRASFFVLGPLLARAGEARVSLPGGCAIGTRPVDLHLEALQALGTEIEVEAGYVNAKAPKGGLTGGTYTFPKVSVGATENMLMAATTAKGETRIENAAREPEIVDLVHCLNAMGAKVSGAGTDTLVIEGVDALHGAHERVIPDRIEAGTYLMAAAMTGGSVTLQNVRADHLDGALELLGKAGAHIKVDGNEISVDAPDRLRGVDVETAPYPLFPTDLQAQFMALMTLANGASMITETIFENRFMHVPELVRLGADITVHGKSSLVRGVDRLRGAAVMATDLRASSSLIIAALGAMGNTDINRVYHLDRGYERLEEKLQAVGARVERLVGQGAP